MKLAELKTAANSLLLKAQKHAPEIMLGAGILATTASIVMAVVATTKVEEVLDAHKEQLAQIDEVHEKIEAGIIAAEAYPEEVERNDKIIMYTKTAWNFTKLYGPALSLYILGIGLILGGHKMISKRNVALMAAYNVIEKGFGDYRSRVVKELGVAKDSQFMHGTQYEEVVTEVIDPETKKKSKKKEMQEINGSAKAPDGRMYDRIFGPVVWNKDHTSYTGSPEWTHSNSYNESTLVIKQAWANAQLQAKGYLFLNDVYKEFGFPETQAGQVVGWIYRQEDGGKDGYVSFGDRVDKIIRKDVEALNYRDGDEILLQFNVDGVIWNLI